MNFLIMNANDVHHAMSKRSISFPVHSTSRFSSQEVSSSFKISRVIRNSFNFINASTQRLEQRHMQRDGLKPVPIKI